MTPVFFHFAKIRHWAALPHALMQLLTPWRHSAQSQQPEKLRNCLPSAVAGGMVVKGQGKLLKWINKDLCGHDHGNPSYPPKATPLRNKALLRVY